MAKPEYWCVGGTSAGHILPALYVAQRYVDYHSALIVGVTDVTPVDRHALAGAPQVDVHIPMAVTARRAPRVIRHVMQAMLCGWACVKSIYRIGCRRPSRIITTGGIVAIPVSIAARLMRVPIDLYELNAVPGRSVYYLSAIATNTYVCFSDAASRLPAQAVTQHVAYPLAPAMGQSCSVYDAREQLGIPHNARVLLVLGGSQGSAFINRCMREALAMSDMQGVYVLHQTGYRDAQELRRIYAVYDVSAHVFSFTHDMHLLYRSADGCIARAGAGTLHELAHYHIPSYIIPLELSGGNHQLQNAYAMQRAYPDLFFVRRQSDVSSTDIATYIHRVTSGTVHTPAVPSGDGGQPERRS